MFLVKNVDGLYTQNPSEIPDAQLIEDIMAGEMLTLDMIDLVLEPKVVKLLSFAEIVDEVRIINGYTPGNLTKTLRGEKICTIIRI